MAFEDSLLFNFVFGVLFFISGLKFPVLFYLFLRSLRRANYVFQAMVGNIFLPLGAFSQPRVGPTKLCWELQEKEIGMNPFQ